MRLVTSIMTIEKLEKEERAKILEIFRKEYSNKAETFMYDYEENKFHEYDVDLLDIEFSKDTIYEDINKLIMVYEKIIDIVPFSVDFIAGNDDTGSAVDIYEKDWCDIESFGLFVTTRDIKGISPYYSSKICNAYLNFEYVSFGCIF